MFSQSIYHPTYAPYRVHIPGDIVIAYVTLVLHDVRVPLLSKIFMSRFIFYFKKKIFQTMLTNCPLIPF